MGFGHHHEKWQRRHERCHQMPRGPARIGHYVRSRLHRKIFLWFGASIVMTAAVMGLVLSLVAPSGDGFREDWARFQRFTSNRFEERWDDPADRDGLARAVAVDLGAHVTLYDAAGATLSSFGPACANPNHALQVPVERAGAAIGSVLVCSARERPTWGWVTILMVIAAFGTLWAAAGIIARRLTRPLQQVVHAASEIGQGKLGSRVRLGRQRIGEIGVLADAIDDMAVRIEKQLADQRELLATVSHEIRTPLGHIRVLLELADDAAARGKPLDSKVVHEIEREVLEIDDLVGELLASSRLSFDSLERRPLEALDVAARALDRVDLPLDLLECDADSLPFTGDATLLSRALTNLLENAKRHGQGVARLVIEDGSQGVTFAVEDHGPGFAPAEIEKVFESFYRGEHRAGGSLGLGLSLVKRIAVAHGGRAWAENLPEGGARVAFRVGRGPAQKTEEHDEAARDAAE